MTRTFLKYGGLAALGLGAVVALTGGVLVGLVIAAVGDGR